MITPPTCVLCDAYTTFEAEDDGWANTEHGVIRVKVKIVVGDPICLHHEGRQSNGRYIRLRERRRSEPGKVEAGSGNERYGT